VRIDAERDGARLELRVLELEDTVAAMARIIGTMTDMLGGLNKIASHYADTVAALMPMPVPQAIRPTGQGRCGGTCACAAADPDDDGHR